jgi:hypothetical protein
LTHLVEAARLDEADIQKLREQVARLDRGDAGS